MFDLQGYEASILKGRKLYNRCLTVANLAMALVCARCLSNPAPYRWARAIATLYTTVIRGIPDLALMMLIFHGQILLNNSLYSINEWLNEWFTSSDPNHEWTAYLPDYIDVSPFIGPVY